MLRHLCIIVTAAFALPSFGQPFGNTSRVTEVLKGRLPEQGSSLPRLSHDGRFLVYQSFSQNIVYRDFNMLQDVFVYDTLLGWTDCVSRRMDGETAWGGSSTHADVSDDGRFVVFMSTADNLVENDTNGVADIFVRDRIERRTIRVSVGINGTQSNGGSVRPRISGDGRYVVFISYASNLVQGDVNGSADAFRHNIKTGITEVASLASDGNFGNGETTNVDISTDGSVVAFSSGATNLVEPMSFNEHVYVRDFKSVRTLRVSVTGASQPANGWSGSPSISGDGNSVSFASGGTNLVPGDLNGKQDIFVRRLTEQETIIASIGSNGVFVDENCYGPSISSDGLRVVFSTRSSVLAQGDNNNDEDVFLRNLSTNETTLVSSSASGRSASGRSMWPSIDGVGQTIAFESTAPNIIHNDTNNGKDVFVYDTKTHLADLGSRRALDAYGESPSMSSNGRYVAFRSGADTLHPAMYYHMGGGFVHDRLTGLHELISVSMSGAPAEGGFGDFTISAGGRYVAFDSGAPNLVPGDTNWVSDIFVRDLVTETTTRVSVSSEGKEGNGNSHNASISADGRYVAFFSVANNLVPGIPGGVFVHDRVTGITTHESVGLQNEAIYGSEPQVSEDGRFLVFLAHPLPAVYPSRPFTQVYLRDRESGTVRIMSANNATPANGRCFAPSVSANGRYVAFSSEANNLVPNDTNGAPDVFRFDTLTGEMTLASVSNSGEQGVYGSVLSSMSADGNYIFFSSFDSNLVENDNNNTTDVFVRNILVGTTKRVSLGQGGIEGDKGSGEAFGRNPLAIAFSSYASNFIPVDSNASVDVFVLDRRLEPSTVDIQNGVPSGSPLSALRFSDDLHLAIDPVLASQPVILTVEGSAPTNEADSLEFEVECMVNAVGITQTIELFNYDTGAFDLLAESAAPVVDQSTVVLVTSNASSYISQDGKLRARVSLSSGGSGIGWSAKFDHIRWSVNDL